MQNRTKRELGITLKNLMTKKSLEHITVKELVTECGVNRQTCYYHFQDIYELLGWIYKSEALGSIAAFKTYETWQLGFLKIFQYVEANRDFCLCTVNSLGRDHLEKFLYSLTYDLLIGVVEEVAEGFQISEDDKSFIAKFYTYGFVALMLEWLKSGAKEAPAVIIDKLDKLINGEISRAIEKYTKP